MAPSSPRCCIAILHPRCRASQASRSLGLRTLPFGSRGQLVDELDDARTLVVGEVLATPGDHAVGVERRARARLHDGVEDLAPLVVGHAEDGAVDDVGVLVEAILDLARIDVHAARDHHVALAVGEVEVAVLVEVAGVADGEPPAAMRRRRLVGVVVVLEARRRRLGVDRADLARRQRRCRRRRGSRTRSRGTACRRCRGARATPAG